MLTWKDLKKGRLFLTINRRLTFAPIWLPHCPACRCTISLILLFFQRGKTVRVAYKNSWFSSWSSRILYRVRGSILCRSAVTCVLDASKWNAYLCVACAAECNRGEVCNRPSRVGPANGWRAGRGKRTRVGLLNSTLPKRSYGAWRWWGLSLREERGEENPSSWRRE